MVGRKDMVRHNIVKLITQESRMTVDEDGIYQIYKIRLIDILRLIRDRRIFVRHIK